MTIDPIFIKKFPYHTLSSAQQSIYNQVRYADKAFLLISRQVGKSNLLSYIWWDRIIMDGKVGESYLTLSPKSGDVEKLMLADILTEAFGGSKLVHDLNSVYIKPPSSWLAPIMDEHEKWLEETEGTNNLQITSKASQQNQQPQSFWSLYLKNGLIKIKDNEIYVKLFFQDISQTGGGKRENYFSGVLFNGANIFCLGATHTLSSQIRGKKFAGNYGEEMGEYPEEPFSALLPAITSQKGWMMYAGTPNKNNPLNWLYEQYIEVKNSSNCEYFIENGVEFYKSKLERKIPNTQENILKGEPEFIVDGSNTTIWAIGDIENIFPYVYKGQERFTDVQLSRKYPHKMEYLKDEKNQYILDNQGKFKYKIVPDFQLNKDGTFPLDPPNNGLLNEEQYDREYRVKFTAGNYQAFPDFIEDVNVISHAELLQSTYFKGSNTIGGYDQGIADKSVIDIKGREGKSSASCKAKVLCIKIPFTNQYQYVIYEVEYLSTPVATNIAHEWLDMLNTNIPIIAENALWTTPIMGGIKPFNQIINADDELKNDRRAYTDVGIFKCFKRQWQDKFNDLNLWFRSTEFKPKDRKVNVKYVNPINPLEPGRKLYITDNCKELIKYFNEMTLEFNSADNSRKPAKMREDQFDAATYPMDILEYKENVKIQVEKFWNNSNSWINNSTRGQQQREMTLIEMMYLQNRKKQNTSFSNRRW
jgi:hypothetical protein